MKNRRLENRDLENRGMEILFAGFVKMSFQLKRFHVRRVSRLQRLTLGRMRALRTVRAMGRQRRATAKPWMAAFPSRPRLL
jgi:hypothetical protein